MEKFKVHAEIIHFDAATYKETVIAQRFIGEYDNEEEAYKALHQITEHETLAIHSPFPAKYGVGHK